MEPAITRSTSQYEKQYEMLREEIINCTRLSNEFSTFSMTALAAVLAFALSENNPFLFAIPYILIIPLSSKSLYYRNNIATISAYMIVVLEPIIEGYRWESSVSQYNKHNGSTAFTIFRNYEYCFESVVCLILYLYYAVGFDTDPAIIAAVGIICAAATAYVSIICYKMAHTSELKKVSIKRWEQVARGDWNAKDFVGAFS